MALFSSSTLQLQLFFIFIPLSSLFYPEVGAFLTGCFVPLTHWLFYISVFARLSWLVYYPVVDLFYPSVMALLPHCFSQFSFCSLMGQIIMG